MPRTFGALVLVLVFALALSPVQAEAAKTRTPAGKTLVCKRVKHKRLCWYKRVQPRVRTGRTFSPVATPVAPTAASAPTAGSAGLQATPLPDPSKPAALPNLVPMPPSPSTSPVPPKPDCGTSPWVGYTAEDLNGVFKLTGKRTCVPGASVMFQLRNTDAQDHNLYAEAPGQPKRAIIENAAPGETKEASATLATGEWRLFCDIEGHESMSRTLTVTG